jgi:hypothetical protein
MFHNRIARLSENPRYDFPSATATAQAMRAGTTTGQPLVVVVPWTMQQAAWQAQVYRLAYERALADLEPPKHFRRFFSVWN